MVDNQDTAFITTTAKQTQYAATMKLFIARLDSQIIIKGQRKVSVDFEFLGNTIKEEFEPVRYVKGKENLERHCWDELNKISSLISPRLTYTKDL